VTPVVGVIHFTTSTNSAKFRESILRLIEPTERPAGRSALAVEIDAVSLPFDVVALSLLLGYLDLNVVELGFILDSAHEAESVVESAPVSWKSDVVIDGDSHKILLFQLPSAPRLVDVTDSLSSLEAMTAAVALAVDEEFPVVPVDVAISDLFVIDYLEITVSEVAARM